MRHFLKLKAEGLLSGKACHSRLSWFPSPSSPLSQISTKNLLHGSSTVETWKYQEVLAALQSSVVYSVDMKEYFVLIADIEFQRSARRIRVDQNGKIIEEIITSFTLQITLTRSSSKNHMGWENSSIHSCTKLEESILQPYIRQRKKSELFWKTPPGLLKKRYFLRRQNTK